MPREILTWHNESLEMGPLQSELRRQVRDEKNDDVNVYFTPCW